MHRGAVVALGGEQVHGRLEQRVPGELLLALPPARFRLEGCDLRHGHRRLPALTGAQQAAVQSAVSVGAAPVTSSTPPQVARVITGISHAAFASGMHTAFLVAAAVALAGALIGLLIRPGQGTTEGVHAGL